LNVWVGFFVCLKFCSFIVDFGVREREIIMIVGVVVVVVVVIFLELDSDSSEIFEKYRDNCSNGFFVLFLFY
jgi:hypothetical protein